MHFLKTIRQWLISDFHLIDFLVIDFQTDVATLGHITAVVN